MNSRGRKINDTYRSGGEGGILPLVQQEIPVMMVKPNLRVCNGTEAL
jgi:hypothetical protein